MIRKLPLINFRKIIRISPSQFGALKNCTYRSILTESLERKPLLPVSASASYGTVLHKMLELISIGAVRSVERFEEVFTAEIADMEKKLIASGWHMLVPLYQHVKDFTMRKIMIRDQISPERKTPFSDSVKQNRTEQWLVSNDGLVGGLVDLISERDDYVEIIDFKTGPVTDQVYSDARGTLLKEDYTDQLKLYAYLYFEQKGRFPDQLSLIDIAKQKYVVKFSPEECIAIFAEAKQVLGRANRAVETGVFFPNPTERNCRYCLYRPGCEVYLKTMVLGNPIGDLSGVLNTVLKSRNGNVGLLIDVDGREVSISDLPRDAFDDLLSCEGRKINVFNLRRKLNDYSYGTKVTTMIYEHTEK